MMKLFLKRYDDVEEIKKILFTVDPSTDRLYEKIDEEESKKLSNSFPIKLYIADPPKELKDKAASFNSKIKFAVGNKFVGLFGLAHAALQIGDKMVHFLDNNFVKIDQFKAGRALLLINISQSGRLPKTEEVKTAIAEIIVEWNKTKYYDQAYCNCQDFVETMCMQINEKIQLVELDKLGLSFKHNKILRAYLEELVKSPEKTGFHITIDDRVKEFHSHVELDKWERENQKKLQGPQLEFLKGFHRAFQLRYAAAVIASDRRKLEQYEPDPDSGCTRGNATLI